MLTLRRMDEVQVSAPAYPYLKPMKVWRLHRSDNELRKVYQQHILRTHGAYIPLCAMQVGGDYKKAA